jgi:hypothetical protein
MTDFIMFKICKIPIMHLFRSLLSQKIYHTFIAEENMLWRARNYADAKLYERAQNMETPSCDQLQKIYS